MIKTLFFSLLLFSFSSLSQVNEAQENELQKVQDLLRYHQKNKEAAEKSDPQDEFHVIFLHGDIPGSKIRI